MKKRRSNGEGGLSWDKERQKWCGTLRDTNGKPHKFRHVDKVEVINWLNKMRLVYSSLNPLYSYDTTLQDFAFAFIKNKTGDTMSETKKKTLRFSKSSRPDNRSCVYRRATRNSQPTKSHWRLGSRYCYRQTRRSCPCNSSGAQNTFECDQQSIQSNRARGNGCNSETLGTIRFTGSNSDLW